MIEINGEDKVEETFQKVKNLFSSAGMRLREFFGASKEDFRDVPEDDLAPNLDELKYLE